MPTFLVLRDAFGVERGRVLFARPSRSKARVTLETTVSLDHRYQLVFHDSPAPGESAALMGPYTGAAIAQFGPVRPRPIGRSVVVAGSWDTPESFELLRLATVVLYDIDASDPRSLKLRNTFGVPLLEGADLPAQRIRATARALAAAQS